jgi:hypothetical protein
LERVNESQLKHGLETIFQNDIRIITSSQTDRQSGDPAAEFCKLDDGSYIFSPRKAVWTRAARRAAQRDTGANENVSVVSAEPLFRIKIVVEKGETEVNPNVRMDWLVGRDRKCVEAFWAFLVRKLGDACKAERREPEQRPAKRIKTDNSSI